MRKHVKTVHGADFYANKKHKGSEFKGDKDSQSGNHHGDQNSPEGSPNSEGSNMTNPGSMSSPSIKSEVKFLDLASEILFKCLSLIV